MLIGGFQKFSLIDYPAKISAVIFTQGCNFRCPYCHNPELVYPQSFQEHIPENSVFDFLSQRQGKLDAVTITGGEPTLHNDLPDFIARIKEMGFLIKLDTNGSNPVMVKQLIDSNAIDYLAMDIKAPFSKYHQIVRAEIDISSIKQTISLIRNSSLDYEFRTTLVENFLTVDDVLLMGSMLYKAKRYSLQQFVTTDKFENRSGSYSSFSKESVQLLKNRLENNFGEFFLR
jgi:anaerobic ribonucleoside-triphosphate reductase activating protein